jgi:hypothetical protein
VDAAGGGIERVKALKDAPSASIRISLARNTYPAGRERDWAMLLEVGMLLLGEHDFAASAMTPWMLTA